MKIPSSLVRFGISKIFLRTVFDKLDMDLDKDVPEALTWIMSNSRRNRVQSIFSALPSTQCMDSKRDGFGPYQVMDSKKRG